MRKDRRMAATALAVVIVCPIIFLLPLWAVAKPPAPIEGVTFDVAFSMKDNLTALKGKDVYVHLRCGKTLQGFVKSVGDHMVHLEKLAGRDFFDALIRTEDISAVEVKFRDIK